MREFSTKDSFVTNVQPQLDHSGHKITVVGVGAAGIGSAFSILTRSVSNDIALVDSAQDKLEGEALDLQHGSSFLHNARIVASTDYAVTAGSRICVLTAGARLKKGETRFDLLQRNVEIAKNIIPQLLKYSPDTILLIVSNPVDILTHIAWKISGLPKTRVIGSGTNLDSSRFRFLISQRLGIGLSSCHGWIIGEHGDSSVAVWSSVNVAGVRLQTLNPSFGTDGDDEKWSELHQKVITGAYEVNKRKGNTGWATGLNVSGICEGILKNSRNVYAVSVLVQGLHDIKEEVFLSLPAVLGENGVTDVIIQPLENSEKAKLQKSAQVLSKVMKSVKW
ncbi:L-lactate dehydrogenase-like isoform X2 [Agrilus planipennis]|nr:L-lactate dehydrogenase-like isoform X2 [Agrilus planipennis]